MSENGLYPGVRVRLLKGEWAVIRRKDGGNTIEYHNTLLAASANGHCEVPLLEASENQIKAAIDRCSRADVRKYLVGFWIATVSGHVSL